ncbi:hypothetical protein [Thermofilum sp.]|uniref:hypothetical protein n=1 Tax=Thermofilum sp. TaxID=1961369 RepID=UPI0031767565
MFVVKDFQAWLASELARIRDDLLAFTKNYNPAADAVRDLRPEDIGLTEGTYGFSVNASNFSVVSGHTVRQGFGIAIFGIAVDANLGDNASFVVKVDGVKRLEIPLKLCYVSENKCVYALNQLVYVQQGAKLDLILANTTGTSGSPIAATVIPLGFTAAPKSQLGVA